MIKKPWMPLLIAAGVAFSLNAAAQTKEGHWTQGVGGPVWKNSTGLCWKQTSWTPAMAIEECDPDLIQKAPAITPPPPPPPVTPAPAPKPKPVAEKVTLAADVLFDFDKAVLKNEGKGEKQPVASNKSKDGRQKNRRVEIEVIGTKK